MPLSPEELQASLLAMVDIGAASTPSPDGTPSALAKQALQRIAGFVAQPDARLSIEEEGRTHMPYDRRVKTVRVDPHEILAMFQDWKKAKYLAVHSVEGIPEGARVVDVSTDHERCCIVMTIHHDDFEEVCHGECPPELFNGMAPIEHVKLKKTKKDGAHETFEMPDEE